MIKFLDTAFVNGHHFTAGMIAEFGDATERALIAEGDAENYYTVKFPVEVLSSSAAPVTATLTGTDEILASFDIPAGTLGVNSILQIEPLWTYPSSANNKILKVKVGGVMVYNFTRTTSVKEAPLIVLANRNSLISQFAPYESTYVTASATAPVSYAIDFASNVSVEITGQRASASESLKLEYYRALHFAGA
jgi:hypothetical protein